LRIWTGIEGHLTGSGQSGQEVTGIGWVRVPGSGRVTDFGQGTGSGHVTGTGQVGW